MNNIFFKSELFTSSKEINQAITPEWIKFDIRRFYREYCSELIEIGLNLSDLQVERLTSLIHGDLLARLEQDPIALSADFIYRLSKSFNVIFCYRIAHELFHLQGDDAVRKIAKYCSFRMSEISANKTGIEIHPEAKIGRNFVIDHGLNTLIGATSEIGNDCTILQNVVLGARKITFNKEGKRHPTLGDNVHVSGGVRILGAVHIGQNTFIGPDCLICEDIAPYSRIKVVRKQQVVRQLIPAQKVSLLKD